MRNTSINEVRSMLDYYVQEYQHVLQSIIDQKEKSCADEVLMNMQKKYVSANFDRCVKDILQITNALCKMQLGDIARLETQSLNKEILRLLISLTGKAVAEIDSLNKDYVKMIDNLKQLMYLDLAADEYEHLYKIKLAQSAEKSLNDMQRKMLLTCVQFNPIYQHIMTYGLDGDEMYRYPFVCNCTAIEFEQYFLFLTLSNENEEVTAEKKTFVPEIKDLLKSSNEIIVDMPSYKELMNCLQRCNTLFNKGWDEEKLRTLMIKLFKSSEAVQLDADMKNYKKAKSTVAHVVGRLKKMGVYRRVSDREFAEVLSFEDIKPDSVTRYVNEGQGTDLKLTYLDWIENNVKVS